jgi:cytochrome c oxidase subunit III
MDIVTNQQRKKIHPHKFILWVAIASIVMMFAGLTSAFIVKSNLPGWKNIELPKIFWFSTAVILLSSLTVQIALRVVLQAFGFANLWEQHIRFSGSAGEGQFLYVIFGLHALHVIGGVVALLVLFFKAFFGKIKLYSSVPVEVAATYWHFVDALWLYLLVFFILIG